MQAWAAIVVAVLSLTALIFVAYLLLRLLCPQRLAALFAIGEEKLSLTKVDGRSTYYAAQHPEPHPDSLVGHVNRASCEYRDEPGYGSDAPAHGRASPGDTTGSEYEPGHNLPRAGSAESLASDTSVMDLQPDVSAVGQVEVGLEYDRDASELIVSLIQGRDLPAGGGGGVGETAGSDTSLAAAPDLCASLALLPDAANVRSQTKPIKRSQNPVFKERFLYSLEPHQLAQKTVHVQVLALDARGAAKQRHLGETEIRLADVDLQRPLRLWLNLREQDQRPSDYGELMFSLSYLPTAERLTVVIVKAKNLKWPRQDQTVGDVLVKVHLIQHGKRLAKKKTTVKKNESQPTYNEAMIFNVSQTSLSAVQLRLTVAEMRPDGRLASIGHVIIGSQTGGTELTHWQQMVTSLRKPVAMWHQLRKK